MERRGIFDQQIEATQRDLRTVLERAGEGSPDQRDLMDHVVKVLSASLEDLGAAREELRQQDEALLNARQGAEAGRQRYQELFEFAPDGYLVTDADGTIREANRAAAGLLRVAQSYLLGKPLAMYVAHEDRDAFHVQLGDLAQAEQVVDWELRLKPHRAPAFPASIAVAVARDGHGRAVGLRWQLRDMTQRKQGEEALRQAHAELESRVQARMAELAQANEALRAEVAERKTAEEALRVALEKYRVIFESLPLGITVSDHTGQIVETNKEAVRLLGVPRAEHNRRSIDDPQWRLIRPDGSPMPAEEYASVRALQENRLIDDVEMGIVKEDGDITWINVTAAPIPLEGYGVAVAYSDITKRVQAEERLMSALAEKEVLMREIYHRVKNNVQVLIYLMDMQAEYISDPDTQMMIRELQERARAMALVHEKLYQSRNLAQINFGTYLNDLVSNLSRAFSDERSIAWCVNAEDALLGVDTAIPCGLIVNELLTNALKYAFPGGEPCRERGETECEICVDFSADAGRYTLVVRDNGVGLPFGVDWGTVKTLGLQLINILAHHQLGGQVEVDRQAGTSFKITFAERVRGKK